MFGHLVEPQSTVTSGQSGVGRYACKFARMNDKENMCCAVVVAADSMQIGEISTETVIILDTGISLGLILTNVVVDGRGSNKREDELHSVWRCYSITQVLTDIVLQQGYIKCPSVGV